MFITYIFKVLSSNLGQDRGYYERSSYDLPQSLQVNEIVLAVLD
jgi:hypothetical protein